MLITRLLLVLEVLDGIPTYRKSCAGNLVLVFAYLTLGLLEVLDGIPTYRKSCAGNLLVWSDLTLGLSFKDKQG